MKIAIEFYKLNSLPVAHQPDVVVFDFADRGYSPETLKVWLDHNLLTQEQHDELLAKLPRSV